MGKRICSILWVIILIAVLVLVGDTSARSQGDSGTTSNVQSVQTPAAYKALRGVLEQERINAAPFPHLQGTDPLTLPNQFPPLWSCPKCMPEADHRPVVAWQYWQAENYFFTRIAKSPAERDRVWLDVDYSSLDAFKTSVKRHRDNLWRMLGVFDLKPTEYDRVPLERDSVQVEDVTVWLQPDFSARALVFAPAGGTVSGAVIAIPDANQLPYDLTGILEGATPPPWLQTLLQHNVAVAVPLLVQRTDDCQICKQLGNYGGPKDERRILEELGFIVGRTMTGLDVQQVLAVRDFLTSRLTIDRDRIELLGTGQGGMIAFYSAAVDQDFSGVSVKDYFQKGENSWEEPVDRMLYGQLNEFGDAEVAALIAPRPLDITYDPNGPTPPLSVKDEAARAQRVYDRLNQGNELTVMPDSGAYLGLESYGYFERAVERIVSRLGVGDESRTIEITTRVSRGDADQMSTDHFLELHSYLRRLDEESDQVRDKRWQLLSGRMWRASWV